MLLTRREHLALMWLELRPKLVALAAPRSTGIHTPTDVPGGRFFVLAVLAAIGLHLSALAVWNMLPKSQVIEIPVVPLNITLGNGDNSISAAPASDNHDEVERAMASAVVGPQKNYRQSYSSLEQAIQDIGKAADAAAMEQAILRHTVAPGANQSDITYQFVRDTSVVAMPSGKTNSKNAAVIRRYEQVISAWVQKFKLYPEEARAKKLEGETVVRVRIDRLGNVRHYMLQYSTGTQELDRAAIDMVRRASPVPAVPNDYPPGELLEFLIPVNFHLQ